MNRFKCVTINGEACMVDDPEGEWVKLRDLTKIVEKVLSISESIDSIEELLWGIADELP